ncbi:MAG: YdcF family protein [Candidatus Nanoarchaeia archaeon]
MLHFILLFLNGLDSNGLCFNDVIIIFGCRVFNDGTPSKSLQIRLDKAIELYSKRLSLKIVVTGATGRDKFNEALAMKIYLCDNGVSNDDVIMDYEGKNTLCSAINVKKIMDEYNFKSAIIVTQHFHIARAKYMMKKIGIKDIATVRADTISSKNIRIVIREIAAFYFYICMNIKRYSGSN